MKKSSLFLFVFSILFISSISASEFHVSPFTVIHIAGNVEVVLEQGDHEEVSFLTDEYNTNVSFKNGILKIKRVQLRDLDHTAKVKVTYKNIYEIKISSGASVYSETLIEADNFILLASTGSTANLGFKVKHIEMKSSEGSLLKLEGATESMNVRVLTGGEIDAFDLQCNNTYVRASTGGHAKVVANELIDSVTSLGGEVDYKGNPKNSNTRTVMGGDAEKQ